MQKGPAYIVLGCSAFLAENLILSEYREPIIETIGAQSYHRLYSTLSTLTCASIAYSYFRHGRGQGPTFRTALNLPFRVLGLASTVLGVGIFSQSLSLSLQSPLKYSGSILKSTASYGLQCPFTFTPSNSSELAKKRITRHPQLWALAFCGLGSAVSTIYISESILFSFPLIMAILGGTHQDARHLKNGALSKEVYDKTSLFPFMAIADGRIPVIDLVKETSWTSLTIAVFAAGFFAMRRDARLISHAGKIRGLWQSAPKVMSDMRHSVARK